MTVDDVDDRGRTWMTWTAWMTVDDVDDRGRMWMTVVGVDHDDRG